MTHKRIVLTGGPAAGKSTAAQILKRELNEKTTVVPEAATLFFKGGVPRSNSSTAQEITQKAIFQFQKQMEKLHKTIEPDHLLIFDRGTLDGAAYWPNGTKDFLKNMNTTLENEYNGYNAVIFFESAAKYLTTINDNSNTIRTETLEEAAELDKRLLEIWRGHPNFYFIKHEASFIKKLNSAFKAVLELTGS